MQARRGSEGAQGQAYIIYLGLCTFYLYVSHRPVYTIHFTACPVIHSLVNSMSTRLSALVVPNKFAAVKLGCIVHDSVQLDRHSIAGRVGVIDSNTL